MTFLAPALLWFLAAASVPVAIHFLNKRRHKTVQWAAMQFLLKATRESRGKKKLRHILILTCRALGIAALAFAASRPVASHLLGWGAGTIDTVVLVLDRSASMELRSGDGQATRRALVLQEVRKAMADLGNPRLILVDSASGKPQEIPSHDVLGEISATAATASAADFPSLMATATEVLVNSTGSSELWLASDLQASNWHPEDERWAAVRAGLSALREKPSVRILSLNGESSSNSSLRLLGTRRTAEGLDLELEILRREEDRDPLSLPLTTSQGGAKSTESLTVPGQSLAFRKQIRIADGEETGHGWLSIPADGNMQDNQVFFAYGPARPVKSLVVAPPGEAADYLLLAAAPPGFERQSSERIDPAAFQASSLQGVSMVLWAGSMPAAENAQLLTNFLEAGGQLVFLPGISEVSGSFLGMEWKSAAPAASGKFFLLGEWNRNDGPLRDGMEGTPVPAERLRAIKRAIPSGDAAVLASWEDGETFLTRKIVDRGTLWFMGSLPDYTWSNLGDADVLLPALQRILAIGNDRFDSSYLSEVGDGTENPPLSEPRILIEGSSSDDSSYGAGVFRVGEKLLAVNRPLSEDDLEIATKDQLDAMLEGTEYHLLDQSGSASEPSLSTDMWRFFLIAVLFFLISESLLCLPKKPGSQADPGGIKMATAP